MKKFLQKTTAIAAVLALGFTPLQTSAQASSQKHTLCYGPIGNSLPIVLNGENFDAEATKNYWEKMF